MLGLRGPIRTVNATASPTSTGVVPQELEPNMAWKRQITDAMGDVLRFLARGSLLLNCILLSVAKVLWFTIRFLNRTIFQSDW